MKPYRLHVKQDRRRAKHYRWGVFLTSTWGYSNCLARFDTRDEALDFAHRLVAAVRARIESPGSFEIHVAAPLKIIWSEAWKLPLRMKDPS